MSAGSDGIDLDLCGFGLGFGLGLELVLGFGFGGGDYQLLDLTRQRFEQKKNTPFEFETHLYS